MIAILTGGTSSERDIAIRSSEIFQTYLSDADTFIFPEDRDHFLEKYTQYDLVIPVFHGQYGEDGQIFAFLATLDKRTAFSPWTVHAITIDKHITDTLVKHIGIDVANESLVKKGENPTSLPGDFPLVVKPNRGGSTIGTHLVENHEELAAAIREIHDVYHDDGLVQTLLSGREFTVSLIGNTTPDVLGITEICNKNTLFDYEEKYHGPSDFEVCPADIDASLETILVDQSKKIYTYLGCRGIARIDWRCDHRGIPHFLEVNTIPGMTSVSLLPKAALTKGYTHEKLVHEIVRLARS